MKTSSSKGGNSVNHNGNHVDLKVDVPEHLARRIRRDAKRRGVAVDAIMSEAIQGLFEDASKPNVAAESITVRLDPDVAAISKFVAKARGVDVDVVLREALRDGIDAAMQDQQGARNDGKAQCFNRIAEEVHSRVLDGPGTMSLPLRPFLLGEEWERIVKRAIANARSIDDEVADIISDGLQPK